MEVKVPYESDEQIAFVEWFRLSYPKVLIFAIPNGGTRKLREALKLREEGVKSGVPDLFIPAWKVFIEMKRQKGGSVSKNQKIVMEHLNSLGYRCQVCRGYQEAKDFVVELQNNASL